MSPVEFLIASQNNDGGWGYKPGGMSFVEPTAAVLLAFRHAASIDISGQSYTRGLEFLRTLQGSDGGWGIARIDDASGWMTAWAVWALVRDEPTVAARGVDWLLGVDVLRTTDPAQLEGVRHVLGVDASLRGWPWQALDASWTFPTSVALLALQAVGRIAHPRVQEGIHFLIDRAIPSGGWNIGNPSMLGAELPPTIINTAIVLASLHRMGVADGSVSRGHDWLSTRLGQTRTAPELAFGVWALREIGAKVSAASERLITLQRSDGSWSGNPFITAMAMLALA